MNNDDTLMVDDLALVSADSMYQTMLLSAKLDELLEQHEMLTTMFTKVKSISRTKDDVAELYSFCINNGYMEEGESLTSVDISTEGLGGKIQEVLMAIIAKIVELVEKFTAINRIRKNALERSLKTGPLSNVRAKDIEKFERLVFPFYKKKDCEPAIKLLATLDYKSTIDVFRTVDDMEHSIKPEIIKALLALGTSIKEDNVENFSDAIETGKTMHKLGWSIDDIPKLARNIISMLDNNITQSNAAIKYYKRIIKKASDSADEAARLRDNFLIAKRLFSIIQDAASTSANRVLNLSGKL